MFAVSERVVCVDDTNPNPLCTFPLGCVVRGRVYCVIGIGPSGGIQIEGLPVIGYIDPILAIMRGLPPGPHPDVGWKRHRFRKMRDIDSDSGIEIANAEPELVGSVR